MATRLSQAIGTVLFSLLVLATPAARAQLRVVRALPAPAPGAAPGSSGVPVTFSASGDDDIDHFQVEATAGARDYSCRGTAKEPCRLELPPGTEAHVEVTVTTPHGDTEELSRDLAVGDQPELARMTYVRHKAPRVVGWTLFGVCIGPSLALGGTIAFAAIDAQRNSRDLGGDLALGYVAALLDIPFTVAWIAGLIVQRKDEESFTVDDTPAPEATAQASPKRSRVSLTGLGLTPLQGGGGSLRASFSF
ncbi:MAG: hypothetical protein ACYDCL_05550 [Myxococcales bacterium]